MDFFEGDIPFQFTTGFEAIPTPEFGRQFDTLADAENAAYSHARAFGYALAIERTNKDRAGKIEAKYIRCDRGSTNLSQSTGARKAKSRRIQCPFGLRVSYHKLLGKWILVVRNREHNHEPSPPETHPSHRRTDLREKRARILSLFDDGTKNREILRILRQEDSNTIIQSRDISNLRRTVYRGHGGGQISKTDSNSPVEISSS